MSVKRLTQDGKKRASVIGSGRRRAPLPQMRDAAEQGDQLGLSPRLGLGEYDGELAAGGGQLDSHLFGDLLDGIAGGNELGEAGFGRGEAEEFAQPRLARDRKLEHRLQVEHAGLIAIGSGFLLRRTLLGGPPWGARAGQLLRFHSDLPKLRGFPRLVPALFVAGLTRTGLRAFSGCRRGKLTSHLGTPLLQLSWQRDTYATHCFFTRLPARRQERAAHCMTQMGYAG